MNQQRTEGLTGASKLPPVRSDAVVFRTTANNTTNSNNNRKSLEFPIHRKVYDVHAHIPLVKKSFSFDWRTSDGEVVNSIVEERSKPQKTAATTTTARKVQLACVDNDCRVIVKQQQCNESEKTCDNKNDDDDADGVCDEDGDSLSIVGGLVSCVRPGPRRARALRCRSSPAPAAWPPERVHPGRLCHSWYAGYGTLLEDEPLFIPQKSQVGATVATCGARRRAEGRRRRTPLVDPPLRLSVSSASLNLLPRISATVIPLRRKDAAGVHLTRSAQPLLEREPSTLSLLQPSALAKRDFARSAQPLLERSGSPDLVAAVHASPALRKCETVLALTRSSTITEPLRPVNRLRSGSGGRLCSRCSSLLSLAATGSRYSLAATGGFVPVGAHDPPLLCKLCLEDAPSEDTTTIEHCGCLFCTKCMKTYVEYEIMNGAYDISCPDSHCPTQGIMDTMEVEKLVNSDLVDKHRKFRLNHEVAMDGARAFCPRAGCETICLVSSGANGVAGGASATGGAGPPQPVLCPTCSHHFCSACTNKWHAGMDCAGYMRQMALEAGSGGAAVSDGLVGLTGESDLIKWCPMCHVPIEKDEGCAQMMCKRCKHVFCWYCLASLDDDFLLRHYDKGPCKNKLGHSRASVIWHRAQVVGIFAGFGLLLLVASPLLLLAAPCIIGCKCRLCNTHGKTVDGEEMEGMDLEADETAGDDAQNATTPITD